MNQNLKIISEEEQASKHLLSNLKIISEEEQASNGKHLLSNLKIISEEEQASNGKTSPFKSENGNASSRSAPSGSAPRPPEEDGRKCPAATGL